MSMFNTKSIIYSLLFVFCLNISACIDPEKKKRLDKLQVILDEAKAKNELLLPIEEVLERARAGEIESQLEVGLRYRYGKKSLIDYKEAFSWLHMAAVRGNAFAQREVGAFYYFLSSSNAFDIPKPIRELSFKERSDRALLWYGEAALGCDSEAQFNLSIIHGGDGEQRVDFPWIPDSSLALKWMRASSLAKFQRAIHYLTLSYLFEVVSPRNIIEGLAWNSVAKKLELDWKDSGIDSVRNNASSVVIKASDLRALELIKEIELYNCPLRITYNENDHIPVFPEY
jgi:hypothetical protein